MNAQVALVVLVATLVLFVLGVSVLLRDRSQRRVASRRATPVRQGDRVAPWRRQVDAMVQRTSPGRSVADRLLRAGAPDVRSGDVILATLAAAGLVFLLTARVVATPVAALLAVAAVLGANAYLDRRVRTRAEEFAAQLPDVARILANAAGAGMAMPNALALAAREVEEPAATILSIAVRQMDVGQTLAGAMAAVEQRAPSREMAMLVATLLIQQRSGGDVIDALREMSVNLEQRRDLKREVETTMAGVRFSSFAVMGLGGGMLLVLESIAPGTLRRLTSTAAGQILLATAGLLYVAGYLALRRLTRVEV